MKLTSIINKDTIKDINITLNIVLMQYPLFINIIIFILGIFTADIKYLLFFILLKISDWINYGLKLLSKQVLSDSITDRPLNNGIIYTDVKLGTGLMPFLGNTNLQGRESKGFPSGHSQTVGIFTTIMILNIYNNIEDNKDEWYKNRTYYVLIIIGGLVLWQRWYSNCHTLLQIFTGTLIGIGLGIGSWEIYNKYIINI